MNKKLFALISLTLVLAMALGACGSKPDQPAPSQAPASAAEPAPEASGDQPAAEPELEQTNRLVVYSAGATDQNEMIQKMWSELHPDIELEVVSAGSGELQNRIIAEASNPQGDVMMGGSYAVYKALEDQLTPYVSPNTANCLEEFVSQNDKFTAIQINVNTIIVNNSMLKDLGVEVTGWNSLLNEKLKGNIVFADPSSSSSGREHVVNMLAAMNTTGNPDDGWDFVEKYVKNLDGKVSSSSSAIYTGVVNGEYAVGITNEEKVIQNMVAGADVSAVYAEEGITLRTSYMGIINGCANEYNARLFVDFMTSKEYQQAATDELYQRSVHKDVAFNVDGIAPTNELNSIEYPTEWVNANADNLKTKFQDLLTNV